MWYDCHAKMENWKKFDNFIFISGKCVELVDSDWQSEWHIEFTDQNVKVYHACLVGKGCKMLAPNMFSNIMW